jgi:phage terminase large subunit-like protein
MCLAGVQPSLSHQLSFVVRSPTAIGATAVTICPTRGTAFQLYAHPAIWYGTIPDPDAAFISHGIANLNRTSWVTIRYRGTKQS